ncbi:MAG: helix-turn-helix domain-containing protein [Gemmatimonadaceae bacterium]|nr:helix-turn-helix domain-containing protein [Gemmatimonadaceae bacterium]
MTDPILLRITEACTALGCSRAMLYRLISDGQIQVVHIGSAVRIPVASLDAYVARLVEAEAPGISTRSHETSYSGSGNSRSA